MKIDIERVEAKVLEGSEELLNSQSINRVIFEVSKGSMEGVGSSIGELYERISSFGYTVHLIREDGAICFFSEALGIEDLNVSFGNFIAMPHKYL